MVREKKVIIIRKTSSSNITFNAKIGIGSGCQLAQYMRQGPENLNKFIL